MSPTKPTLIGDVQSVSGATVSVRLRAGLSSLQIVDGDSHRVGQIGSFLRIPQGYTQLYGICSQVGAAALPHPLVTASDLDGRWLTVSLFGEALGDEFQRGVSQYPTFGDEVHLVTAPEMRRIYGSTDVATPLTVGSIASTSGLDATLDLSRLVNRHSVVVGSTGSGKSNLVAVMLEAIASQGYPSSRVLVIDPHGEYASAVGALGKVFSITPEGTQSPLYVPYWALPFDEFAQTTLGELNVTNDAALRAEVEALRRSAAASLAAPPPDEAISADAPIPFSAKRFWAELTDYERRTYKDNGKTQLEDPTETADPDRLIANSYPPQALGGGSPFLGPRRGLSRNLELMRNRLADSRYQFLFAPGADLTPDLDGRTAGDLDTLLCSWVGHDKPVTVMDLSGTPADVLSLVVGCVLRIVYDSLYWAAELPNAGRQQPLLVILEEAHLFLPEGRNSIAQRTVAKIAKEGRKYGVGLMLVTQRPTDLDSSALSQCGTMMALRLTNQSDQAKMRATMPDDLANLAALLPALRTGEAIMTGEALPIPSRVRVREASYKPVGADPDLAQGWKGRPRPAASEYSAALDRWRSLRVNP
jgi:hypothetical protein